MSNNPTTAQIDALLTFLEEHQELARGHLRNAEGRNRSRNLWARLTDELNALGGYIKNVKQWQKVWPDKKYLTKKAAAAARRSASATGGGPSTAGQLSAQELRIISVMGEGYGEPESDARVPAFPQFQGHVQEVELDSQAITTSPVPPSPAHEQAQDEPQQQQQREESLTPQCRGTTNSAHSERRRRPRHIDMTGPEQSVRRRLFEMEERRVATEAQHSQELSLIREAIQELCRTVQASLQEMLVELRTLRR